MPSINRLTFFTIALSLMLSLFCLPLGRTTFASLNLKWDARQDDHSPAYKEGMEALSRANYERAAEHFKQAAADKPDDMWAFYYLGLCFLRLKSFSEAANAYQQALTIKPKEAAVHYQLCKIYLEMGASDAAEKERRWLQENDRELAMYLSDPVTSDKSTTQQSQNAPVSSADNKLTIETATANPPTLRYSEKASVSSADNKQTTKPTTADPRPIIVYREKAPVPSPDKKQTIESMTADLRPTILYREKAKYTEIARINHVQGTVVLQAVFAVNGKIQDLRVIRGLPDGLTHKAIEATWRIRFNPATRNDEPVSVRGQLEFTFNLY